MTFKDLDGSRKDLVDLLPAKGGAVLTVFVTADGGKTGIVKMAATRLRWNKETAKAWVMYGPGVTEIYQVKTIGKMADLEMGISHRLAARLTGFITVEVEGS